MVHVGSTALATIVAANHYALYAVGAAAAACVGIVIAYLWSRAGRAWAWLRARWRRGQERVIRGVDRALATWQAEGRITAEEAAKLHTQLTAPAFQIALRSLASQFAISFLVPFPFDGVARPILILVTLGFAAVRRLTHRIDHEAWETARSVHSPLVIVLSAVPILGSYAYLLSPPMRANRLLVRIIIDATLRDLPWHLYERSGLRGLIARRVPGSSGCAG